MVESIDGTATANELLAERRVTLLEVDGDTADIRFHFDNSTRIDAFNNSCGYEGWQASFIIKNEEVSLIGMGGGSLTAVKLTIPTIRKS